MRAGTPSRDHAAPSRRLVRAVAAWAALAAGGGTAGAQCVPSWSAVAGGLANESLGLTVSRDGAPVTNGPFLVACGPYYASGKNVAMWNGGWWSGMGAGLGFGGEIPYRARTIDGRGALIPRGVYVGGDFQTSGSQPMRHLAYWSGDHWVEVAGGTCPSGRRLGAHGREGPNPTAGTLLVGSKLPIALPGGQLIPHAAAWNGASWQGLTTKLSPFQSVSSGQYVGAFTVYDDDGPGPRPAGLYVGGWFGAIAGVEAASIARWDGATWEDLDWGVSGVSVMCPFDEDGAGPQREALFVGGPTYVKGFPGTPECLYVYGLARWDGQAWSTVPGWFGGSVYDMAVFDDDGPGPNRPALFLGGFIGTTGGLPGSGVVKWDGQRWGNLAGGVGGFGMFTKVNVMAVFDEDGPGPNPGGLYVAGYFSTAGGVPANYIARWGCPRPPPCDANCNLDYNLVTGAHVLSIADFACFQTRFVLQDPYADCDADGQFTIADFACFQAKFAAGCP